MDGMKAVDFEKIWRDRRAILIWLPASLTAILILGLLGRAWKFRELYFSASARHETTVALATLQTNTGWDTSNFNIEAVDCDKSICVLRLGFDYHAPSPIHPPTSELHLTWKRGQPGKYELR